MHKDLRQCGSSVHYSMLSRYPTKLASGTVSSVTNENVGNPYGSWGQHVYNRGYA